MTEQEVIRLKNRLWTEEFRPLKLEDVIGHEEIILRLKAFVEAENSLEFLFSGPPASGKTTTAIAFARDLFGKNWERNFTELNASDERGIDVVRNKIKDFAGTKPVNAPFKIIFLDEVDELCLKNGTLILTGTGPTGKKFTKIEDVPKDKWIPMQSVNLETGEIEKDRGICVDSGYAEFWKITLANGKTLTASEKHPFFIDGRKEIKMRDIDIGTEILDFADDLGLNKCEICGEITTRARFCSMNCKDAGHSNEMTGKGNPQHGKESWAKGLTKADTPKVNQGTFGDVIYIHHIDGNHENNDMSNLMPACLKCHNTKIHNLAQYSIKNPCAVGATCADGINCPELVEVIDKEYIGRGKAYNITMQKNPCFFLHNGILTHNTKPAQGALRRTIEKYSNTCRFILSCNYDNKLIPPIKSRLMSFHFAGLNDDNMKTLAYRVVRAKNLSMSDEAIDLLVELSDKDTRVVLNTLQVCALLGNDITVSTVKNTLQVPDKKQVLQMINSAISGDLDLAFEIGSNHIINSGFDVAKILRMIDKILPILKIHPNTKCALLNIISDTEDRINHGGTPDIQLRGLLSKFALATAVPPECPAMQKQI